MHRTRTWLLLPLFILLVSGCNKEQPVPEGTPSKAPQATPQEVPPPADDSVTIAVVQTNDVHGYILPQRTSLAIDKEGKVRYPVDIGGIEWLAGYVDILRRQFGDRVLLLDGGDMFQGTMISNEFEGATVTLAMNHVGYDAASVGNHEFDFGPEGDTDQGDPYGALKARGKQANFPFLAANLYDHESGKPIAWEGFAPYTIVDIQGIKVGIVGGPTTDTPTYSKKRVGEGVDFRPLDEAVKKYVPEMREKGAKVIIGLLHAGGNCEEIDNPRDISSCDMSEELFEVAGKLEPGTVDLLVGAHTHKVIAHWVNGIPAIESGGKGMLFGMAKIHYSPRQQKVTGVDLERPVGVCHYHFKDANDCVFLDQLPGEETVPPTFLGEEVKPVRFLERLFTAKQKEVLERSQEKLGAKALADLAPTARGEDLPMGLLLTHVLMEKYPQADIALFNSSGIRALFPAGDLTVEDVYRVLPFDSRPAFLKVPGSALVDLLRLSTSGAHGGPVVRGLKVVVDNTQDECIQEDWDGDGKREGWERNLLVSATLEDGTPIDPKKSYILVTTSYLAHGGSDYRRILDPLGEEVVEDPADAPTIRDLLTDWLRAHPVELGGPDDTWSRAANGPLVKVHHPDHVPGTECRP